MLVDEETRFALGLVAISERRTMTEIVAGAAMELASKLDIGGHKYSELFGQELSVRWCMIFSWSHVVLSHELQALRTFVLAHSHFFYDAKGRPNRRNLVVLWPQIESLSEQWHATRMAEPFKTAKVMASELRKAGVEAES